MSHIQVKSQNHQIMQYFSTKLAIQSIIGKPIEPSQSSGTCETTIELNSTRRKLIVSVTKFV